jgi:hypothetical protein
MLYADEGDAAGETQLRLCLDSSRICESADHRRETPAVSDRVDSLDATSFRPEAMHSFALRRHMDRLAGLDAMSGLAHH